MSLSELQVPPSAKGGIITIGNFDGVHRGHQEMLARLRRESTTAGLPGVVVTFDPHPMTVLKPHLQLPRLTTIPQRITLLKQFGGDAVVVLPVGPDLLDMSPRQFFDDVIRRRLAAVGMIEGPDFRFGKDRTGDITVLNQLCHQWGVNLVVQQAVCVGDGMISSTRIRRLMEGGDFDAAIRLLGHPYTISGVVRKGAGRGQTIGFPTANLTDIPVMLPADGVYAASARVGDRSCAAALNIGANPTFGENTRKVECHLSGYSGDLYGKRLQVEILKRLRNLRRFQDESQLKAAIRDDVARCVQINAAATEIP